MRLFSWSLDSPSGNVRFRAPVVGAVTPKYSVGKLNKFDIARLMRRTAEKVGM